MTSLKLGNAVGLKLRLSAIKLCEYQFAPRDTDSVENEPVNLFC